MTELGEILKEARIKKGYDIEEIQKKTKIQKRYLEAIEDGNLDALPGHFYARAFVKSYAEAVGLDPDMVLGHVKTELPSPTHEEQMVPLRRTRQQHRQPLQTGRWLSRVLLYLFAVLILFVIYIAVSESDQLPGEKQNENPSAATEPPVVKEGAEGVAAPTEPDKQTAPAPNPNPQPAEPVAKATLAFVKKENNIYRYELSGAKELQVSITATANCWMRVLKGGPNGEKVDELTLTKGTSKQYSFPGATEASIRMGAAPDVQIQVNGQGLDTSKMQRSSQIISITLKP